MATITVTSAEIASTLQKLSLRQVKDVRAIDVDLLIELSNGDRVIVSGGAVMALTQPDLVLQFADGALPIQRLFQQIEQITLSPEANLTVSSREITRYNKNNARLDKAIKKEEEAESKPVVNQPAEQTPQEGRSTTAKNWGNSG